MLGIGMLRRVKERQELRREAKGLRMRAGLGLLYTTVKRDTWRVLEDRLREVEGPGQRMRGLCVCTSRV
jgi:hypothetical protein